MWDEPYLETCCRSALHRLCLSGEGGRSGGANDAPCLARLERMGLAERRSDGRYQITQAGDERRKRDALRRPS
jgi:hypothetical protein